MSYRIEYIDDIVHVIFWGVVDGLIVMQSYQDEGMLPKAKESGRLIFDFSQTEEVDLSFDEVKAFGTLAKVESNFIDTLHIVLVLSSPAGLKRAEHYRESIAAANWRIDIVETLDKALAQFSSI